MSDLDLSASIYPILLTLLSVPVKGSRGKDVSTETTRSQLLSLWYTLGYKLLF